MLEVAFCNWQQSGQSIKGIENKKDCCAGEVDVAHLRDGLHLFDDFKTMKKEKIGTLELGKDSETRKNVENEHFDARDLGDYLKILLGLRRKLLVMTDLL